ncbi:MAG: GH3 auxin-responsive promoter family protein [Deltaproteobacteria bacterium]|nr:GH3 auxin-responsive promoter family protein [Deltaproteobacteria bacterium]
MLNLTPILKLHAKRRTAQLRAQDYAETQKEQLAKLIFAAQGTKFGQDHMFSKISSISEYQSVVPLRYYENFWEDYWKADFPRLINCTWPGLIKYFPVTSGTTSGATKYIPFSREMQASNQKAGVDLLVHHLNNQPHSKIFGGRSFMLGGSTDLVEAAPGIFTGDLSGIAVKTLPWWARQRYFPPTELALLKDWEEKIEKLATASLDRNITLLSGVPSWLLIFCKKLFELVPGAEGKLHKVYPNLEMLVHGGVSFAPYYAQFCKLLEGSRAEMREVYPASEGFIAIADRRYAEGLRLNLDHGIFYEFVPLTELTSPHPTRHWIENIEKGVSYAIVITTCAGLWSYVIGDTVKFIDLDPPRILVTGRTSYCLSAFGEHLIAEEIEDAVAKAAAAIKATVTDYSVAPVFPQNPKELGGHLYIVEFVGELPSSEALANFCRVLDERLCERNEDYAAHRAGGFGLKAPQVIPAKAGTFAAWMKHRGKLGGQNKVPRIITGQDLFEDLKSFAQKEMEA